MSDVISEGDGGGGWLDATCDEECEDLHMYHMLRATDPGGPDHLREELDLSCAMRPEPHYADKTGYMHALERSFTEHIRHVIRLSYLRFFSKLLDTGKSDRHFHTRFENLRSASTPTSGFPTGVDFSFV